MQFTALDKHYAFSKINANATTLESLISTFPQHTHMIIFLIINGEWQVSKT